MSKDKYPSIFSPQMATIVFIILQIFFATRAVLKIGEYSRRMPCFGKKALEESCHMNSYVSHTKTSNVLALGMGRSTSSVV